MDEFFSLLKAKRTDPLFQSVLSALPEFIFKINQNGIFLDFYAISDNLLAVKPDQIVGNALNNFFSPELTEVTIQNIAKALKTNEAVSFQYPLSFNNQHRYYEARLIPQDKYVIAFISDITKLKEEEVIATKRKLAIEASEQKFRLLAENLPGAVYLCNNDANYSMFYLNDRVRDITGYTPEEFITRAINFPELYHPDDIEEIYKTVGDCLTEKKAFHLIYRLKHKSGDLRWIEEFGAGVFNEGELIYLEGYLQDITDRREAEQKIIEQNEALRKANSELDRFVYSASHDLRSPLSSLLGLINLAAISNPSEINMLLELMKDRVNNLDSFIREITFYSQNARLDLELESVQLSDLINESISALKYAEDAAGIHFCQTIPGNFSLNTDRKRLQVILNNILGNAIKYADLDKRDRFVKIGASKENGKVKLIIEDNGIGIAPQHLDKVFNMFYRASEKSKGSGLGLYIVKEAITKLNGSIEITSELGNGTRVQIELPE
jgi:PAS domain S-box-containing protein